MDFGVEDDGSIGIASAVRHLQRAVSDLRKGGRDVELAATRAFDASEDLKRRVANIEATKPDVMQATLATLVEDVQSLRRALYTFAFSVVGGSILFAFTAFKVVG